MKVRLLVLLGIGFAYGSLLDAYTQAVESKVKYHMRVTLYYYQESASECQGTVRFNLKPWQSYTIPNVTCPLYKIEALIEDPRRKRTLVQRFFTQKNESGCGKHGFVGDAQFIIRKEDTSSGAYEIWREK